MTSDFLKLRVFLVAPAPLEAQCAAMLRDFGCDQLSFFPDLAQVLAAATAQTPDLIIVAAPEWEDRVELVGEIRALQAAAWLPVLLLAAPEWSAANCQTLISGALDAVSLPLQKGELGPRVASLLRARFGAVRFGIAPPRASRPRTARPRRDDVWRGSEASAAGARLEGIVTHLQTGILVMDENRRAVLVNPEFCRIFGIETDPKTLIGFDSHYIAAQMPRILPDTPAFWERIREIVVNRETVLNDETALTDGRTLSRDCAPIFCGGTYMGHVWSYRDISERTNFERESMRKRDLALQSAKFQAEFLANMSHEIRTPINGVLGMLGLLADTPLQSDQRGLLQTAQTSADALLHIINDILDFSKVKAGKLHIEDGVYTPVAVLDDCLQTVIATAHDKGLELLSAVEAEVPLGVRGDGARVRQVITNLLSNAIKFTHRGEIEVSIEVVTQCENPTWKPPLMLFRVCDSGIGIPEDAQKNLFQPFTQADGSTTRRYGGTGLGLAICKQLVERMGGHIGVESGAGRGSTFWFTLPLVEVEIAEESRKRDLVIALSDARVLVVEDNATIRRFLLQQLSSWHITGEGARTGGEAMHRLRSAARAGRAYDAALLDAQLPDTDARALAAQIKADPLFERTDLLLMTALGDNFADKSAFCATISKPVRQSQLYEALLQLFGGEAPARAVGSSDAPRREERDFGGARVLLADDNAINREVALRWLQKWGCHTTPVINGREALQALERANFDLIFMDCQMPEMDGYEASGAIRQMGGAMQNVPIVALTAHAMEGDREKCLAAGMNDYLSKPVRPDDLAAKIERWTGKSGQIAPEPAQTPAPSAVPSAVPAPQAPPEAPPAIPTLQEPVLPPLDLETLGELREAVGDDEFPQFVEMFYEQSSECERLLRQAMEQSDRAALSRVAHSLKGVSRQYGAREVSAACEELELLAKGETAVAGADFEAKIEAVRRVLMRARSALHQTTVALQSLGEMRS